MTKIERMIGERCLEGVEFVTLGDVCKKIFSGKNKNRTTTS